MQLDILVNNAARMQVAPFHEISSALDKLNFEINVFGPIALTRLVVNHWYANNQKGHVVAVSSAAGKCATPMFSTYGGTKHALHGYFESLRIESYKKGVSVTMVCPGPVVSNLAKRSFTSEIDKTYKAPENPKMQVMTTRRCAQLMAVAIANKLDESWAMIQPILIFAYISQYFPTSTRWLLVRVVSERQLEDMKSGNY